MTRKSKSDAKSITLDVAKVKDILAEQKDFLVPVVQEE